MWIYFLLERQRWITPIETLIESFQVIIENTSSNENGMTWQSVSKICDGPEVGSKDDLELRPIESWAFAAFALVL